MPHNLFMLFQNLLGFVCQSSCRFLISCLYLCILCSPIASLICCCAFLYWRQLSSVRCFMYVRCARRLARMILMISAGSGVLNCRLYALVILFGTDLFIASFITCRKALSYLSTSRILVGSMSVCCRGFGELSEARPVCFVIFQGLSFGGLCDCFPEGCVDDDLDGCMVAVWGFMDCDRFDEVGDGFCG